MKTETKKTNRRVPERIVMAHFNDKLAAYVNTGIASCSGSNFERISTKMPAVPMLHMNARRHRPAFALPHIGLVPFAAEWPVADIADTLAPDQHRRRLLFRPYKRRRLLFLSPPPSPPGTATDPQI